MDQPKPKKISSGVEAYRKTDVMTSNRETILLMMYSGAVRFLKQAIEAADRNDISEKTRLIGKTQQIVTELRATLNHEAEKQIAETLENLYDFIMQRLLKAMMEKSTVPLTEALGILNTLHSAWEEAIQSLHKSRAAEK